jgi:phosphomannomutase/phosphoglucomutase
VGNNTQFPASVFKAYDIRGTVPDLIDAAFARSLGVALAARAREQGVQTLVVGRDGRLSSEMLSLALQEGMLEGGVDTLDVGMVPTPLVYFAANIMQTGSGVAITGSHNPPKYNGFKMMMGGRALYGDDVQQLAHTMNGDALAPASEAGTRRQLDLAQTYIARVASGVKLARPMKIAIDCGNGVAGAVAPQLFRALGCEVDELFCEVDGNFPNHHPDPAEPKNLQDLIKHVAETDCELGLAFDGDGDRLGIVTKDGQTIFPDRQMMLFAQDVLSRVPGGTILFDVKCSQRLAPAIRAAGGEPLMWKTGHSLVKARMKEVDSPLGGEMSGHIFFKERWYGFDDGTYAGARLLEILSKSADPSAVLNALPTSFSTPELNVACEEGEPHRLSAELQQLASSAFSAPAVISTIDGLRVDWPDGFGLIRASNTTPVLVLRFEGQTQEALHRIEGEMLALLRRVKPDAQLGASAH